MSLERERYEQMTAPASLWQRIKRLFVFPPLPQESLKPLTPGEAPEPGRIYLEGDDPRVLPAAVTTLAPRLDDLHPAFSEPIIGYVSANGWRIFRNTEGWWTSLYRDQGDLAPRGGIIEVEVRIRRVISDDQ